MVVIREKLMLKQGDREDRVFDVFGVSNSIAGTTITFRMWRIDDPTETPVLVRPMQINDEDTATVSFLPEHTMSLVPDQVYRYDVKMIDPFTNVKTLVEGRVFVEGQYA